MIVFGPLWFVITALIVYYFITRQSDSIQLVKRTPQQITQDDRQFRIGLVSSIVIIVGLCILYIQWDQWDDPTPKGIHIWYNYIVLNIYTILIYSGIITACLLIVVKWKNIINWINRH